MAARTGHTYLVPGGVYNTQKKTYTGSSKPQAGYKKTPPKAVSEVPVVTTSPSGQVTTSGFSSQKATQHATRKQKTAVRTERRKTRAVNMAHRATARRQRITSQNEAGLKRTEKRILTDRKIKSAPTSKPAPSSKPRTFEGKKTAGTPTRKELGVAKQTGTLKTNQRGYLTTPPVRKASRELKQAQRVARKQAPKVEGPLTPGQKVFARDVSRRTGLSPRVVAAQELAEESGSAAVQREAEGNHNWLNIGYFDSGPGGLTQDPTWRSPKSAAHATAQFFKGRKYGPSEGIRNIIHSRGQSDQAQIEAIANSGWATSPTYRESLEGTHALVSAKPGNPKAAKRLKAAKVQAAKVGLTKGKRQNSLKVFGKQVARQLQLIKAKEYAKGPGKLIVGGSDVVAGHEPEIAARLKLLSAKIHKPIYIISGHRTPQHSVEVGGFADDPHTEAKAADIGIGSALRESAGQISEAEYESVGLHRPYYPESSAEINHVELLNGGTPNTGAMSGGVAIGGAMPASAGVVSGSSGASLVGGRRKKGRRLTQAQKARRTFRRLKQAGIGVGEAKPAEEAGSSSTLVGLERKYGVKT